MQPQASEDAVAIECGIGPGAELADSCMAEREEEAIVIRHPDGSFRRLDPFDFGALDGSQAAEVVAQDGHVTVAIGGDRYRWKEGALAHAD